MALFIRSLAVLVLSSSLGWSQTVRTAPVKVPAVPVSVQAVQVLPAQGVSFQQDRLSIAAPGISLPSAGIEISLPLPEIRTALPVAETPGLSVQAPEAPAPKAQASEVGLQIRQLNEVIAGSLKTASDERASPDQSRRAGQDIEKVLTGESKVPVQEDLPPAGPATGLDSGQVAWLQAEVVSGPSPLLTMPGFLAFVTGDAKSMAEVLPWLRNERQALALSLNSMIGCLRRVAESGLPPAERSILAQRLNDRFAQTVATLSVDPALKPKQRQVLKEVLRRFLANRAALFEVTHYLQTVRTLQKLDGRVSQLLAPAPKPAQDGSGAGGSDQAQAGQGPVEHPWRIKPPLPKEQRGQSQDGEVSLVNKTADWAATIKEWRFLVEKHLARYRIAMRPGRFSQRIKEFAAQRLVSLLEDYKGKAGILFTGVERIASYSLVNSFINPAAVSGRPRHVVWLPSNKNLRLVAEPGGYVVKADFETDIQNDEVLRAFKASVEEYWKGGFEFKGQDIGFRTEVSIRKLAPGTAFSPGALTIRDNDKWLSLAAPDVILLGHDLHYATPAHEFGHTMGLADEYRNGYDPERRASVELQNPASIMSSLAGSVLPRHLKLAFLLLKRRSLAPS
ncbi:MAG: hypothetical protein HY748_10070 [Elusimicrobia bacterium]|nr:hypothetical protein [Elusimicrobiota bacterium]